MNSRAFLIAMPLALLIPYAGGCHSDDHEHAALPDSGVDVEGVVYQGSATDEALVDMLSLPVKSGDKTARFTSPATGAKLTDIPTFAWTFGAAPTDAGGALGLAPARGWSTFIGPERNAFAHGELNGNGYFLVLSSARDPELVRVFTSDNSYKPDAATWDKVKKAGGIISAVVTTGQFDNNKVVSGGGPFEGEAISFEVAP